MADMPTLIFEVGFTAGPDTADHLHLDDESRGILDTNTLAPDDLFVDVTEWLHDVSTARTSSRTVGPLLRCEAGELGARLKNTDRRFDPTNLSGPYVSAGVTQVQPQRVVRLRATWDEVTYQVWRGFADAWLPTYLQGDDYAGVALSCTDGFKVLGRVDRAAVGAVGAGEDSGARINRILDSADWSSEDRMVATGDSTLQATTLEGDALAELQLVADSEIGELCMDAEGRVMFRNRNAINEDTRSNTSQATFGDSGSELRYVDIDPSYDDEALVNHARITRVGGAEQTVIDSASISAYLRQSHERSDLLLENDADVAGYAGYVVFHSKDPEYRFESLTINPLRDPAALFPQVLGREIGDRVTVKRRPPGGGTIERDVFIRGIIHHVTTRPTPSWLTMWQLQSATKFSFLTLDNAILGTLDNNALAY